MINQKFKHSIEAGNVVSLVSNPDSEFTVVEAFNFSVWMRDNNPETNFKLYKNIAVDQLVVRTDRHPITPYYIRRDDLKTPGERTAKNLFMDAPSEFLVCNLRWDCTPTVSGYVWIRADKEEIRGGGGATRPTFKLITECVTKGHGVVADSYRTEKEAREAGVELALHYLNERDDILDNFSEPEKLDEYPIKADDAWDKEGCFWGMGEIKNDGESFSWTFYPCKVSWDRCGDYIQCLRGGNSFIPCLSPKTYRKENGTKAYYSRVGNKIGLQSEHKYEEWDFGKRTDIADKIEGIFNDCEVPDHTVQGMAHYTISDKMILKGSKVREDQQHPTHPEVTTEAIEGLVNKILWPNSEGNRYTVYENIGKAVDGIIIAEPDCGSLWKHLVDLREEGKDVSGIDFDSIVWTADHAKKQGLSTGFEAYTVPVVRCGEDDIGIKVKEIINKND